MTEDASRKRFLKESPRLVKGGKSRANRNRFPSGGLETSKG